MPRQNAQSIIIVGAGPVGLCCAIALANAGHQVTVIDSGARGAGWASGGMLAAVYETLCREDVPQALTGLAFESQSLWPSLAKQAGIPIQTTTTFIARDYDEAQFLNKLASISNADLTQIDVPPHINGFAAWHCGRDLALDPREALAALKAKCKKVGVKFVTGRVSACCTHQVILADDRVYEAELIILATGQGLDGLGKSVPELGCITPVKGQLLALATSDSDLDCDVIRAGRLYVIKRKGRVVVGATSQPKDDDQNVIDARPHKDLRAEAIALYPALKDAPIVESWAGLRPMTPDGAPILGQSSVKGVLLACGTYRNGWLLAPAIASSMARIIAGDDTIVSKLQPFSPLRFPI
jgi:glycine oxidase